MELKYSKPKRQRIKNNFLWITDIDRNYYFDLSKNKWVKIFETKENKITSNRNCRSVRAFRRRLKKMPKGVKFTLVSKWVGFDVEGVGSLTTSE